MTAFINIINIPVPIKSKNPPVEGGMGNLVMSVDSLILHISPWFHPKTWGPD